MDGSPYGQCPNRGDAKFKGASLSSQFPRYKNSSKGNIGIFGMDPRFAKTHPANGSSETRDSTAQHLDDNKDTNSNYDDFQ